MANSIRFGTSCYPCKTPALERAQAEETEEKGNTDPDRLVQCPFDKNHQIRVCRFPYHLIKCRKNHPHLVKELKTCPFNACHLVPKDQMMHHTETCPDRIPVDSEEDVSTNSPPKWQVPVSTWVNPNMTEDWDNEADDNATPFVWGINTNVNQNQMSLRTPNTLPWSDM